VGKSRLLYEFRKAVANEDVTFLEGHCLSYSRSVAYQPVIDILKANFNINENDGDSKIREKVQKGLKLLGADEASTEPYLLELLLVKESGIGEIPMSPEAIKDRTIGALRHIILKGSENRPLIIAIEDLHWIDKSSEDLLKDLMDSIPGAKVFLIFTYRPDFVHTWGRRSYHNQVNLNRLSNRESLKMACQILGTNKIIHNLENLILEKTEGIPFFIEEFIRSLKDLELIVIKDDGVFLKEEIIKLSIPSTIQDVIMARVDSLPDDAKETLQVGSAIEREFSFNLIKQVTSLSENKLLSNLSILKDSELLYERGVYPQSTYIFKHALTREVVYNSILTRRKKKLHEHIGDALETLHKDNIIEHYGILSEHYILSDNYEKGAKYSSLAGKQAVKRSSYTDAISYANKGISCLEMLPQTDDIQRRIIDNRTALSNYCIGLNYHYEGMQAVAPIVDLAKKINYKKRLPRIYVATGTYNIYVMDDIDKGIEDLNKAKTLSEETGDFLSLWYSYYFLACSHSFDCNFEKSPSYFQMALDLSESANNRMGICFVKGTIAFQYFTYSGKIDLAYQTSKESLELANQTGDIHNQQIAYSSFGACCFFKGFFSEAETNLLQATTLHKKTKHVVWGPLAYYWLGNLYFNSGDFRKAQNFFNQANLFLEKSKVFPSWVNLTKTHLTYAKVLQNNKDIDLESLFEYAKQNKLEFYYGEIARNIGGILMSIGDKFFPESEKWINKAIESHKRNRMPWYLAEDYALYAEFHKQKGNQLKAKETLGKAVDIFKECGADGWVKKYEKEFSKL